MAVARCAMVHISAHKGITTVARCDRFVGHGDTRESMITWHAASENWQPGDVVRDAHARVFVRTICGYWWRLGIVESFDDDYPTRPLVKLVPEQTP